MFSKSRPSPSSAPVPAPVKRSTSAGDTTFSVIGSDVVITGDIRAEVDLHIDGRIEGDVTCESLVQGESSEIHGGVTAQNARLSGIVKGSIDVRDLVIENCAHISGDVSYDSISIAQGGHVDGQFKHKSASSTGSPARTKTDAPDNISSLNFPDSDTAVSAG